MRRREAVDSQYSDRDFHQRPPRRRARRVPDCFGEGHRGSERLEHNSQYLWDIRTITMPGVQNPHWLPFPFAILSWTGCGFLVFPIPSTVMTCLPSTLINGARHALTDAWYIFFVVGFNCETTCQVLVNTDAGDRKRRRGTNNCASTTSTLGTTKLCPGKSNVAEILQEGDFSDPGQLQYDLGAVQEELEASRRRIR